MDLMKDTFWVLGDSFCDNRWDVILNRYFGKKYPSPFATRFYRYAEGSADTQTIIDNWIKLLPYMGERDAIVVCVSDISRNRIPKKEKYIHTLPFEPNPNRAPQINSYFSYAPVGYDPLFEEVAKTYRLDIPFSDMNKFKEFNQSQNAILSTKSYDSSKKDIIEALYKITPCHKKFIYTWTNDDILKSKNIYSKDWLTENIFNGNWETQHDDWVKSNGEIGIEYDFHLSDECDKLMAEYFIKQFEL